jgi:hypothetical protein
LSFYLFYSISSRSSLIPLKPKAYEKAGLGWSVRGVAANGSFVKVFFSNSQEVAGKPMYDSSFKLVFNDNLENQTSLRISPSDSR